MKNKLLFSLFLILAVIIRISGIQVARHGDINNNTSWGYQLLERGPGSFYEGKNWQYSAPNQPPIYLYYFGTISLLTLKAQSVISYLNQNFYFFPSKIVWWYEWWGELYFAKTFSIISDFGIAYLIYLFCKKYSGKQARNWALVWLISPVSWYNSSIWGGTDGLLNLLGLTSFYLLLVKKNLPLSLVVFSASLLFKGSLFIFLPLFLLVAIKLNFSLKTWTTSFIVSFLFSFIVIFPFRPSIDAPLYLVNLYINKFFPGEIGYLTANSFNFWWIVDSGKVLDTALLYGIPAKLWGWTFVVVCYTYFVWLILKRKSSLPGVFMTLAIIPFVCFMFLTRMHERYLYPFFVYFTLVLYSRKYYFPIFVVMSILHLINLYHLFWAPGIDLFKEAYQGGFLQTFVSYLNILLFIVLAVLFSQDIRTQKGKYF